MFIEESERQRDRPDDEGRDELDRHDDEVERPRHARGEQRVLEEVVRALLDAGVDERDVARRSRAISGTAMIAVPAMFRNGMMPVMFMNRIMKNIVVRIGRNAIAVLLAEQVVAMLTRTKPKTHLDEALERGRGRSSCCRVPSQKTTTTMDDEDLDEHRSRIELERRAFEQQDRREELFDRRAVEPAIVIVAAVWAIRVASLSKQRWLQLRGTDDEPLRRWSMSVTPAGMPPQRRSRRSRRRSTLSSNRAGSEPPASRLASALRIGLSAARRR